MPVYTIIALRRLGQLLVSIISRRSYYYFLAWCHITYQHSSLVKCSLSIFMTLGRIWCQVHSITKPHPCRDVACNVVFIKAFLGNSTNSTVSIHAHCFVLHDVACQLSGMEILFCMGRRSLDAKHLNVFLKAFFQGWVTNREHCTDSWT